MSFNDWKCLSITLSCYLNLRFPALFLPLQIQRLWDWLTTPRENCSVPWQDAQGSINAMRNLPNPCSGNVSKKLSFTWAIHRMRHKIRTVSQKTIEFASISATHWHVLLCFVCVRVSFQFGQCQGPRFTHRLLLPTPEDLPDLWRRSFWLSLWSSHLRQLQGLLQKSRWR